MKRLLVAALVALIAVPLFLGAALSSSDDDQAQVGINVAALPPLARKLLPDLTAILRSGCPDLPALWVLAETQAESSWNPTAFSSAGAAGLLQMMPRTWAGAGGAGTAWTASSRPPSDHPVWQPKIHLKVAVAWMCGNLRTVAEHLRNTGKPIEALDALAVCHVAGCSRVTESATGIPTAGEAGCNASCVEQIKRYLDAIHHWVSVYAAPISVGTGGAMIRTCGWVLGRVT